MFKRIINASMLAYFHTLGNRYGDLYHYHFHFINLTKIRIMNIIQKSKDQFWVDESGTQIPYNRTTKAERLKERIAAKLLDQSRKYHKMGLDTKKMFAELCEQAYREDMKEKGVETAAELKGYTFYCFNQMVKIERSVNGNPQYDEATMEAAKVKFDEYLNQNVTCTEDFIKDMIIDAFESRNGQFNKKRINSLLRYKSRSKNKVFTEACELLSTAVRYPSKSVYYRIWVKDENGKYQNIDLNFSSI